MTDPSLIADMIRAGVSPEIIQRVVDEIMAAASKSEVVVLKDPQAEQRRASDRTRKASKRLVVCGIPQISTEPSPSPSLSSSPPSLSPTPPIPAPAPTLPSAPPPHTHGEGRPSRERAAAMANQLMIETRIGEMWWDTRDRTDWMFPDGAGGQRPVSKGKELSDLRVFATAQANRENEQAARGQGRNGNGPKLTNERQGADGKIYCDG